MIRILAAIAASTLTLLIPDVDAQPLDWSYLTIAYYCMLTLIDIERNQEDKA